MATGDMTWQGTEGSHQCPCGTVVTFTRADLLATFVTATPENPDDRASHSLALPPCPACNSQTFLNCNLPDDHPHPDAKLIRALLTGLTPNDHVVGE